jgi:hypothetical protein
MQLPIKATHFPEGKEAWETCGAGAKSMDRLKMELGAQFWTPTSVPSLETLEQLWILCHPINHNKYLQKAGDTHPF